MDAFLFRHIDNIQKYQELSDYPQRENGRTDYEDFEQHNSGSGYFFFVKIDPKRTVILSR